MGTERRSTKGGSHILGPESPWMSRSASTTGPGWRQGRLGARATIGWHFTNPTKVDIPDGREDTALAPARQAPSRSTTQALNGSSASPCRGSSRSLKRTRNVVQGSVLIPSYGRSSRFGHEADHLTAARTGTEREDDQRKRWSSGWWSPPPESNRRPHPYHGTTRNRCANRRFPRSRPTVGVEVIGSLPAKLCALFKRCADRRWSKPSYRRFVVAVTCKGPVRTLPSARSIRPRRSP